MWIPLGLALSRKGGPGYQPGPLGNLPSGKSERLSSAIHRSIFPKPPSNHYETNTFTNFIANTFPDLYHFVLELHYSRPKKPLQFHPRLA